MSIDNNLKSELFDRKIERIKQHYDRLIKANVSLPDVLIQRNQGPNVSGVYVFSDRSENMELFQYVGQSNNIFTRLKEHCGIPTSNKANFAYKLTTDSTELKPISGSPNPTKQSMFNIPEFEREFENSVLKIKRMDYRWVEVDDKLEKNLLEIYASVLLCSKYNEFE